MGSQSQETESCRFHYSYGFGLRFLLIKQEGINLRADFGFGSDQSAFYLGFGEAF